ncbi:hypothetical protein ACHQM5_026621 [Ranunculus cassubicifolius]
MRPLSPSRHQARSHQEVEEDDFSTIKSEKQTRRRRKIIICFGCSMAGILILSVLILVLMLTIFHIKDPEIKMNRVTIPQLTLTGNIPPTIDLLGEFSVKNPNIASFKYNNSTTFLYYNGNTVGEAHIPQGLAKARRTQNLTLSMEIVTAKVLADPKFTSEFSSGVLTVSTFTKMDGRVRIIKIIKKHVVVKTNCSITVNITSQSIVEQKCKQKVSG